MNTCALDWSVSLFLVKYTDTLHTPAVSTFCQEQSTCAWFCHMSLLVIGHVNKYPAMHYFRIPRHTHSMIAYLWFWQSISGNSSKILHCGNVVNMHNSNLVEVTKRKKTDFTIFKFWPEFFIAIIVIVTGGYHHARVSVFNLYQIFRLSCRT